MNDLEEGAIGIALGSWEAVAKGWAAYSVHFTYHYGPASRFQSVQAKAPLITELLNELDFAEISARLSSGAKLHTALTVAARVGQTVAAIDVVSRAFDTLQAHDKVSRGLANALDFGGALASTTAAAEVGFFLGAPFDGIGAPIGGIAFGAVGAITYSLGSTYSDFVGLFQEGIQAVGNGVTGAISAVLENPSNWEMNAMGDPSAPVGHYESTGSGHASNPASGSPSYSGPSWEQHGRGAAPGALQ